MKTSRNIIVSVLVSGLLFVSCAKSGRSDTDTFFAAVTNSNVQAVRRFLSDGADPNAELASGRTPFVAAIDALENPGLFRSDFKVVTDAEAKEISDLWDRRRAVARLLIEAGGDVKAKCAHGETPLIVALHNQQPGLADLLIRKGADINARLSRPGWGNDTALHCAIGKPDLMQALLVKGANANATNSLGRTPLMRAALNGNTREVEMLIDAGADVNAEDTSSGTALISATSDSHFETVRLLISKGANVNAASCVRAALDQNRKVISAEYWTVLKHAERAREVGSEYHDKRRQKIIDLLKEAGAVSEIRNHNN